MWDIKKIMKISSKETTETALKKGWNTSWQPQVVFVCKIWTYNSLVISKDGNLEMKLMNP